MVENKIITTRIFYNNNKNRRKFQSKKSKVMKLILPSLSLLVLVLNSQITNSSATEEEVVKSQINSNSDNNLTSEEVQADNISNIGPIEDSETENEDDLSEEIQKLEEQVRALDLENAELRARNLELNSRMLRMSSRHQDIVFALTWQYDQLERKAQVYYNSFQTQKQNFGEIATRMIEPVKNGNAGKPSLIPLLWANSLARKQQQEKTEKEIREMEKEERKIQQEQERFDRPVARSYSRIPIHHPGSFKKLSDSQLIGLTLKTAMSEEEDAENSASFDNNNRSQTGPIPSFGRNHRRNNGLIRKRNLNNKNKLDIFDGVSLLKDFDKRIGGIRR